MFETYLAKPSDFKAIEDGLQFVWHKKLDYIFRDRWTLEEAIILSFDSKNFYVWKHTNNKYLQVKGSGAKTSLKYYELFKIPHHQIIDDEFQFGWRRGFALEPKIPLKNVPQISYLNPRNLFSGSLLGPFLASQKLRASKMSPINPYTTPESFFATLVHEFGHFYFDSHLTWWFSNKKNNLTFLKTALNQYLGKKDCLKQITLPNYGDRSTLLSEIFAFCTEYSSASIFWKKYKKDLDVANQNTITHLISEEKDKNLSKENSTLDPDPPAHNAAMVFGKLLITAAPKTWPTKTLNSNKLELKA